MEWVIKIKDKYFKGFLYKHENSDGRHSGHTYFVNIINSDDIKALILVDDAADAARATVELPAKIGLITELMRWGNIKPESIIIEPYLKK